MPFPKTEKDFQIESDAQTLKRAAEIMKDKKRMDAAIKYLEEEKKNLEQVVGSDGLAAALKKA